MRYDLSNPYGLEQFNLAVEKMKRLGGWVELKKPSEIRTNQQNRYLHLILGWFAIEYCDTLETIKVDFFKREVNRDIFEREVEVKGKKRKVLRSTSSLTVEEMSTAITRFRDWSSAVAGIYLPSADEKEFLNAVAAEMERNKNYI